VRIVAGVDVGNATTEVVLVDASLDPPRPLAWDRAPTRGVKGSAPAARAAAALVRRLEARSGHRVDRVNLAPQRPVTTRADVRLEVPPARGPVRLVACGASTPGGAGLGVGRPVPIAAAVVTGVPVVLLVAAGTGHLRTVAEVRRWLTAGADVAAVALADDEGVLVSRRLPELSLRSAPVLDGVDVPALATASVALVEVAAPGQAVRSGADPLQLLRLLARDDDAARRSAAQVARATADQPNAVVALYPTDHDGAGQDQDQDLGRAGPARPSPRPDDQADLTRWSVDLAALAESVELRRDPGHRLPVVGARLADDAGWDVGTATAAFRRAFAEGPTEPEVQVVGGEAAAARAGALSTPGARADTVVLDLGGGTLDAVTPGPDTDTVEGSALRTVTVAGGGELVTLAVAELLRLPHGAAEWAKRGPCERVENPQVVLGEDGGRRFVDRPMPAATVGSLVVPGPAGLLPFTRSLSPAEWRTLRLRVKREVLGRNISRCLAALSAPGSPTAAEARGPRAADHDVLLVGGVAGDGELLRILDLPQLVGRAEVAGRLGHRWAVAYGLTLLGLDEGTQ